MLTPIINPRKTKSRYYFLAALITSILVALLALTISDFMLLAAFVLGPIIVIGILFKPEWGLLLLVFITYTRTSDALIQSMGVPSIAKPFVVFMLLIVIGRAIWKKEKPKNWKIPALFLGAYAVIGLIGLLNADNPDLVEEALTTFVKDALIMLIVAMLMERMKTLYQVIWTLLAAGIFLGSINVFQQLTGTFDNTYWGFAEAQFENIIGELNNFRASGPGIGPNGFGQFMLFLVPLALDRFWNERHWLMKTFAIWALASTVMAVVFTFSRSVAIGLAAVLAMMFFYRPPKPKYIFATIVFAILIIPYVPSQYFARIGTLVDLIPGVGDDLRSEVSFRGRASENTVGILMFLDHPILGVGMANYNYNYQSYSRSLGLDHRRTDRSAHNLYLEIASEQGLVGLAWFAALQWVVFRGLWQARRDLHKAGLGYYDGLIVAFAIAMISYLITSTFRHLAFPRYFWLIYGIALTIPQVAKLERVSSNNLVEVS